jgi:hypothetical protein
MIIDIHGLYIAGLQYLHTGLPSAFGRLKRFGQSHVYPSLLSCCARVVIVLHSGVRPLLLTRSPILHYLPILQSSMSKAPLESINVTEADLGPDAGTTLGPILIVLTRQYYSIDRLYPPLSVPNQASQGESGFVDSSGPIFSMYMGMAEEEDKKMAESWQADADGILIFVCLYLLVLCLVPTHQQ